MTKLFFDMHITGHHSEHINYLVDYILNKEVSDNYIFVVNPLFYEKFEYIVNKTKHRSNILWVYISENEFLSVSSGQSLIARSFKSYKLANKYQQIYHANEVYLLNFNIFQLALIFKRPNYKIKGILFKQFSRMSKKTLREKILYLRKYYTTKYLTKNSSISSIFILNDKKTVTDLNQKFKKDIFKYLPDPVPKLNSKKNFNIFDHYQIKKQSKVFLHIGSLGGRKGTFEIINATLFSKKTDDDIVFLLVGKATDKETEKSILLNIEIAKKAKSFVQIIWDNQFVSNDTMKSLFEQCHIVLMPYKLPEASSGILGHAIAAHKPVIATGKGLLKDLIQENNFGWLLEEMTAQEIMNKVRVAKNPILSDSSKCEEYLEKHTPTLFSSTIIE